jgi:hypothetical protein
MHSLVANGSESSGDPVGEYERQPPAVESPCQRDVIEAHRFRVDGLSSVFCRPRPSHVPSTYVRHEYLSVKRLTVCVCQLKKTLG